MVLPRTPYTRKYGPSGAGGGQGAGGGGAQASIGVDDVYRGAAYVASGVFEFASGVWAGYQAGPAAKTPVQLKGKEGEKTQQKYRERDLARDVGSLSNFGNGINEPHDTKQHERLYQRALAAFRAAEARGDAMAEITEEEAAAYTLQTAIDERLKREEEERRRPEPGKRKVSVPVPSKLKGGPGIYVEGEGFTPIGAYPSSSSSSNPRAGSSTSLLPASFPEAPYSESGPSRSIPDVSSLRSIDSARSSSSYLSSSRETVTARRPSGGSSVDDLSGRSRSRSPGGSVRPTNTTPSGSNKDGPIASVRKGWLGW